MIYNAVLHFTAASVNVIIAPEDTREDTDFEDTKNRISHYLVLEINAFELFLGIYFEESKIREVTEDSFLGESLWWS